MHALNYCRQAKKMWAHLPKQSEATSSLISGALVFIDVSQKFMLPKGGRLLDDNEFKALDAEIRLPFPCIALEYERVSDEDLRIGPVDSTKSIILAYEDKDQIILIPVAWINKDQMWVPWPPISIAVSGAVIRDHLIGGKFAPIAFTKSDPSVPSIDYQDEIGAFLSFLNALSCSNVRMEKLQENTSQKKGKKAALPFDEYHVLTIDTSLRDSTTGALGANAGRSPREHLRRGHIRRYESGLRVWVNAAIVNPGVGGKIHKDYCLK